MKPETAISASITMHSICSTSLAVEHLLVGSFYEIDRSKLPPQTPQHLKSLCIVKVSKRALSNVSLGFPSALSLQAFFHEKNDGAQKTRLPALDAEYLLDPPTAAEVLYRRVPPKEISKRRKVWDFWTVAKRHRFDDGKEERGLGLRREETETEDGVETEEEEKAAVVVPPSNRKRPMENAEKPRREKCTNKGKQIVVHNQSGKQLVKASIARWFGGRYHSADENMLKVMKAKGASAGKTISRLALRNDPGKLIGDTGLLDTLLKHMAGKVAPGGAERFQRQHNTDGAMEYWLDNAELEDIRKEAGFEEPYWTPPLEWKPSDNPTDLDSTCARTIRGVWEEIITRKTRDQKFKDPADQDLAMVSSSISSTLEMDQLLTHVKEKYRQLVVMKSKIEDRIGQVDQFFTRLEEEIMVLKSLIRPRSGVTAPKGSTTVALIARNAIHVYSDGSASLPCVDLSTYSHCSYITEGAFAKIRRINSKILATFAGNTDLVELIYTDICQKVGQRGSIHKAFRFALSWTKRWTSSATEEEKKDDGVTVVLCGYDKEHPIVCRLGTNEVSIMTNGVGQVICSGGGWESCYDFVKSAFENNRQMVDDDALCLETLSKGIVVSALSDRFTGSYTSSSSLTIHGHPQVANGEHVLRILSRHIEELNPYVESGLFMRSQSSIYDCSVELDMMRKLRSIGNQAPLNIRNFDTRLNILGVHIDESSSNPFEILRFINFQGISNTKFLRFILKYPTIKSDSKSEFVATLSQTLPDEFVAQLRPADDL